MIIRDMLVDEIPQLEKLYRQFWGEESSITVIGSTSIPSDSDTWKNADTESKRQQHMQNRILDF